MDKGYGWAILLWRKSIRRFFTSFSSDSSVGLADGRNRPCFCRPEGPLAQFYHSFNTLNTTLRTKSKMYSPVFILFTKIRAIDFCLTWFNSSWCCTYYTSSHLSSPTRMKSKSLRIFLCSLHKWISWVIRGLTDTSLRESTIHYSSHSYSELNYYLESLLHIDQDTTDLQNLESIHFFFHLLLLDLYMLHYNTQSDTSVQEESKRTSNSTVLWIQGGIKEQKGDRRKDISSIKSASSTTK